MSKRLSFVTRYQQSVWCILVIMKYTIRELSWFKRRIPKPEPKPVSVDVQGAQLVDMHQCEVTSTYDDGSTYEMTGWVKQCPIKQTWSISCYCNGKLIILDVIEEQDGN